MKSLNQIKHYPTLSSTIQHHPIWIINIFSTSFSGFFRLLVKRRKSWEQGWHFRSTLSEGGRGVAKSVRFVDMRKCQNCELPCEEQANKCTLFVLTLQTHRLGSDKKRSNYQAREFLDRFRTCDSWMTLCICQCFAHGGWGVVREVGLNIYQKFCQKPLLGMQFLVKNT